MGHTVNDYREERKKMNKIEEKNRLRAKWGSIDTMSPFKTSFFM